PCRSSRSRYEASRPSRPRTVGSDGVPGYPRPRTIPPRNLAEIAELLGVAAPASDVQVSGVTLASDAVEPGDLFAGLPGSKAHGARLASAAAPAGAVARRAR